MSYYCRDDTEVESAVGGSRALLTPVDLVEMKGAKMKYFLSIPRRVLPLCLNCPILVFVTPFLQALGITIELDLHD